MNDEITKEEITYKSEAQTMLKDDSSFQKFYTYLRDKDLGDWDSVNSEEIIKLYLTEMIEKEVHVSHILKAIEENFSSECLYKIWLGNSMETPEPIESKSDLYEALGL